MLLNNLTKRVVSVNRIRLVPGMNELDEKSYETVKESLGDRIGEGKDFATVTHIEKDKDGKPTGKKEADFEKLSAEKATAVVKETNDAELLNKWLKSEVKDSVRKAIYDRLEEIGKKK